MGKVMKNWRYWLLAAVATAAAALLVGTPGDNAPGYWRMLVCSRLAGATLAYADVRLFVWFARRRKIDDLLECARESD